MGPYCQFCNHRCFVPNPRNGNPFHDAHRATILATCARGQEHDKQALGYCWADASAEAVAR